MSGGDHSSLREYSYISRSRLADNIIVVEEEKRIDLNLALVLNFDQNGLTLAC